MPGSLNEQLRDVRELALTAGRLLLDHRGNVGAVNYKSVTEMVTDLDRRVEAQLLEGLRRHFPGDAICAEEGGQSAGSSGRTWFIDPLDGTTNFVHGYAFYSVSLGCAQADELLLAAVYAPYLDELYLASAGSGAILERPAHAERTVLPVRQPVALDRALLATGFPYVRDAIVQRNAEYLQKFLRAQCHGVRRGGSAAIDLCHVAAGKLDGYWEMSLRPWDVAAGTLLAREAGALVTDFAGRAGRLDGASIVAAAPGLHAVMLKMLQEDAHG